MRHRLANFCATAVLLAGVGSPALARPSEDDAPPADGRLEGYTYEGSKTPIEPLVLPPGSTAGTLAMTILVGAACIGVMFKNGRRSHLD